MRLKIKSLILLCLLPFCCKAQTTYIPSPENMASRKEFADMKFGIFLHWGIYSMFAQGEWYMQNANLDWQEYQKAASGFYPALFNAREWVEAIKESGAKYITFTSRHHDSFSMWDTNASDYNIVKATPFQRDIVKELADECHGQDIRLHLYYSHLDWRRADYPLGRTGHGTKRDLKPNYTSYLAFMKQQLTELLTRYGKIGAIWFDGVWDHDQDSVPFDWHLREQYDLIHQLQPSCLVGNNHHVAINEGEDIQIFERDVPGENKAGLSGQEVNSIVPLETCQTMNGMWGYKIVDQDYKSTHELVQLLVRTAGKGANLLLNIGPQPNGELPATAVQRLKEMGQWLKKYGESIYGTTGGGTHNESWEETCKGNVKYIHVLDKKLLGLTLPVKPKIKEITCLNDRQRVEFKRQKDGQYVTWEEHLNGDEPDFIFKITY